MIDSPVQPYGPDAHELDQLMRLSAQPVFNIKAVEQATEVFASTLRAWERRYQILAPKRTDSGYRLYSERDIAVIRWLKHQLDQGMTIGHASALLATRLAEPVEFKQTPPVVDPSPLSTMRETLYTALLYLDETSANRALSDLFSRFSVEVVCLQVFSPLLYQIGSGWSKGEVSIAQEHFASHWVRQKTLGLLAATPYRATGRPIVTASAPTDQHELGILFVALFLARAGWEVIHLGANLAAEGLSDSLADLRPALILVSATHKQAASHIPDIAREIDKMKEPRPILGYGGQAFNNNPDLRGKTPGVYVGQDAEEVVATVERLLRPTSRLTINSSFNHTP